MLYIISSSSFYIFWVGINITFDYISVKIEKFFLKVDLYPYKRANYFQINLLAKV